MDIYPQHTNITQGNKGNDFIADVSYSYWFMEKLNYCEKEKIRVHYRLKEPTLKITNEMLKEIYETEMAKPEWERLLESRFYNYS